MTAMADHAPTITTPAPGHPARGLRRRHGGIRVSGGFAEIGAGGVTVLAEQAVPRDEMTQEIMNAMLEEARRAYRKAQETWENEPGLVDDAAKLLSDMVAVGGHIGLSNGSGEPLILSRAMVCGGPPRGPFRVSGASSRGPGRMREGAGSWPPGQAGSDDGIDCAHRGPGQKGSGGAVPPVRPSRLTRGTGGRNGMSCRAPWSSSLPRC